MLPKRSCRRAPTHDERRRRSDRLDFHRAERRVNGQRLIDGLLGTALFGGHRFGGCCTAAERRSALRVALVYRANSLCAYRRPKFGTSLPAPLTQDDARAV